MNFKLNFNIPLPDYDYLSKYEKKKIKLILIFSIGWIIQSTASIVILLIKEEKNHYIFLGHSIDILGVILILFLLYKKKHKAALVLYVVLTLMTIFMFANFIAAGTYVEYYYLFIPSLLLLLSDNKIIIFTGFFVSYFAFISPNIFYDIYLNFQKEYYVFILFTINFIIVYSFKLINNKSENFLEEKSYELEELNQFQSQFFINISHEIRTPLTLLKGQIDKVNNTDDLAIVQEKMNKQINKIKNIVDDVIDLSKMNNKALQLNNEVLKLNDLVAKIQMSFDSLFVQKNVQFIFKNNEEDYFIMADALYLERVINNLILNAYKYTDKNGKVKIELTKKNQRVFFTICDTGIGIEQSNIDKIFNRFYQVNNDYNKSGGSGIGLTFSKEIIHLLKGEIKVESKLNVGSRFTICFPLLDDSKQHTKEKNKSDHIIEINNDEIIKGSNQKILIVEDSYEMRIYLKELLQDYHCYDAENGLEALDILQNEKIDFVITDYMMPKMNGYEFIVKMKEQKIETPILMLTARNDHQSKLDILRLGIDDYLSKPFDKDELLIRISNILKNYKDRKGFIKTEKIEEKEIIKNTKYTNEIKEYIINNCNDVKLTQVEVAEHFNISKSTFYRKVKIETGLTPKEFISEIKLLEARKIVDQNNNISLKELSIRVGFLHPSYFATQYKKRFGVHPIIKASI